MVDLGVIVGCWGSDVEGDLVSHLVFLVALGVVEDGRFGGREDIEGVGGEGRGQKNQPEYKPFLAV